MEVKIFGNIYPYSSKTADLKKANNSLPTTNQNMQANANHSQQYCSVL